MRTSQLALLSVLTATCIAIQITPRPPNVEFTSLICFTVGATFGCVAGGLLGGLTMFVNGFLSPWGFAGVILPFQVAGMTIIGVAGGVFGKSLKEHVTNSSLFLEAAVVSAFLTLCYDVITNSGYALLFNVSLVPVLVSGLWFSILHISNNTLLFAFGFLPLFKALKNFKEVHGGGG